MEPIAIVGLSCRFPGADDPQAFWQLLHGGTAAIREVPRDRWDLREFYDEDRSAPGKMYTRWGGFLDGLDRFDAAFFGISHREAERIDPQQRLLLELCWEALEDACQVPARLKGTRTGVFIAFGVPEYQLFQLAHPRFIDSHTNTGYFPCIVSNRISYTFDFRGPSLSLDTACSSSLVAVHLACESLRRGESTLALVGGANLMVSPVTTVGYSKLGILTADDRSRAFDSRANGYVRGEGGGVVVLKTLTAALADGDDVHAVIRGEAVNQDGRSNGLTAPNRFAQEEVVREAYARAGVSPRDVRYVEAHGTGTLLGDSIEARALGTVLGAGRASSSPCAIGSVKTNIGHLETAAGMASLVKVVLALKHRTIPATLHFETPNPHIPFEELGLKVQRALEAWPATEGPAVAGVHAYGFGGTNAHVVLEEAPRSDVGCRRADRDVADEAPRAQLLAISAAHPRSLEALAGSYRELLRAADGEGFSLGKLCQAAALHRSHHDHRLTVTGSTGREIADRLDQFLAGGASPGVSDGAGAQGRRTRTAFLFTGQGAQYAAMGQALYDSEPVFRDALRRCDELLRSHLSEPLLTVLYSGRGVLLDETAYTQPALFALEYALARLWQSWGVQPDCVLGHSVGEYVAACIAGVFSLEDALNLIARRGRLMQDLPRDGAMAAVFASEERVRAALAPFADLSIAAINGPEEITISGGHRSLEAVLDSFQGAAVPFRTLKVSHAFHSPLMEPILDPFERAASGFNYRVPRVALVSNLTGRVIDGVPDAAYWRDHLRRPVMFAAGIQAVRDLGCRVLVEIGPQPTLLNLAARCLPAPEEHSRSKTDGAIVSLASLKRGKDDRAQMLESLGALYTLGVAVDWSAFYANAPRARVKLPSYPFQREHCWFEAAKHVIGSAPASPSGDGPVLHPLLGRRHRSAALIFETELGLARQPYLTDHRVAGSAVVPAAAYLEMALAAAREVRSGGASRLEDIVFREPLIFAGNDTRTVQLSASTSANGERSFDVSSLDAPQDSAGSSDPHRWKRHVTGRIVALDDERPRASAGSALAHARSRCGQPIDPSALYKSLAERRLEYGLQFRMARQIWRGDGEALGLIQADDDSPADADYLFHPALLDSCFHVAAAALPLDVQAANARDSYVPVGVERFQLYRRPGRSMWSHAVRRWPPAGSGETFSVDLHIYDEAGDLAAEVGGLIVKRTRLARLDADARTSGRHSRDDWFHEVTWQQIPANDVSPDDVTSHWLILADRSGVGAALAARLEVRSAHCVVAGSENAERIDSVVGEALRDCGKRPLGIVYCWSLDADVSDDLTLERLRQGQALGCGNLLRLIQSLHAIEASVPVHLWIVTRGAQALQDLPVAASALAQSAVWGLARTIHWEHAELHCTIVDLDPGRPDGEIQQLDEEMRLLGQQNQVAHRGGRRFVPRIVRAVTGKAGDSPASVIHADASYMITGGMGGLGLRIARWLVDQGARNLVLVGRRGASAAAEQEIERLRHAANIAIAQADVAREEQTAAVFAEIREALPPLKGIVHAAGILDDGPLIQQSLERLERVAAPKVNGAWNLHVFSRDAPLDFFVMFSSATSLLGSPGQGNYAAANAFLDALAHYRRARGLPAASVNWGPWARVGMAAAQDKQHSRYDGFTVIEPEHGVQMFGDVLRSGATQATAFVIDWPRFLAWFPSGEEPSVLSELVSEKTRRQRESERPAAIDLRRELEGMPANQREDLLVLRLHDYVVKAMGIASVRSIDVRRPLAELGMDSLTAVQLRNTLAESVGCSLPASLLFDYPSLEALAKYLAAEIFGWDTAIEPVTAPKAIPMSVTEQLSSLYDDLTDEELAGVLAERLAAASKGAA
jgi:acyl transferase domain-containing protein